MYLILLIISYGALLLLAMPPTGMGIVFTTVFLLLGISLILQKKIYKNSIPEKNYLFLFPLAVLIGAGFGVSFYNRWLPSSKMLIIANMLHLKIEMILLLGALMLSAISVYFLYVVLQKIVKKGL